MTDQLDSDFREEKERPGFLTVLCVLSFIATGLSLVFGIINLIGGKQNEEQMLESKVQLTKSISEMKKLGMDSWVEMMEKIQAMSVDINNSFYLAAFVSLLISALGLYGVIKMFKGYKIGFHLYIIYSLLSVASLYIYVSPANVPSIVVIINLIIAGLFVFMYSRNLHWMNK